MNHYFGKKKSKSVVSNKSVSSSNKNNINNEEEENNDDETLGISRDNNHIYFYSEIDRTSIFKLTTLIREAEEYCVITSLKLRIDTIPIYLHINSFGGYISEAFVAIDVIKQCSVPIYSIIEGNTASAGTLISVVCDKRFILPSSYMLIHQLSSEVWGKMSEITDEYKNLCETTKDVKRIYRKYTSLSKEKLNKLLNHDLWLNSDKALKYGLVDSVYSK